MKQNKETLKKFFETGDKPTQQQYADLIDSYIDAKQPIGEANRRFVIDETGEVSVASEQKAPEYTLSDIVNNKLSLLKDGVVVKEIDLASYIDDTNLARLVSGTVDANGIVTFTRDDNSTFTVDLSNLKDSPTLQEITNNGNTTSNSINIIGGKSILKIAEDSNKTVTIGKDSLIIEDNSLLDESRSDLNSTKLSFRKTGGILSLTSPNQNLYTEGNKSLNIPYKNGTIATIEDIPQIQAGTNITIDNSNPLQPIINATAGSGATTDLSYNAATRTLASSTGTDAVLPLADATNAGLMKANFYEEGSFTPTLKAGTTNNYDATYDCSYVRIGNKVTVYYKITNITDPVTLSGAMQINLPFVCVGALSAMNSSAIFANSAPLNGITPVTLSSNSSVLFFREDSTGNNQVNVSFGSNPYIYFSGTYTTNVYNP